MQVFLRFLLILLLILVAAVLAYAAYFMLSPMPVVRFLRKQEGQLPTMPPGFEGISGRIDVIRDLEYPSAYAQNTYDLFLPKLPPESLSECPSQPGCAPDSLPREKSQSKSPLILWVHGGAFVAGDKIGTENWGMLLADRGYAVMSINYCHAPEAAYPAQIRQVAEAFAEIRQSAYADRIDFERVAVAGDSAGAYMAVQFALCHTNQELAHKLGIVSPLEKDTLKGALLYCGPYHVKKMFHVENKVLRLFISRVGWSFLGQRDWSRAPLIETVTPMDFVTPAMVPCYITDGNTMSFESHGRELGEALRKHGVFVQERYFPKEDCGEVPHEYQMLLDTENGMLCFRETLAFLERVVRD